MKENRKMNKTIDIKELKIIQQKLLDEFSEYCDKNGLTYYLAYGTLIGAVRHKGYIPWDDDIDVLMPRPDYERFIENYNDASKTSTRVVSHKTNPRYYLSFAKLINTDTVMQEEVNSDYHIGVNIDIFPLDNLADDYETAKKLIKKAFMYNEIMLLKNLTFSKERKWYKNAVIGAGRVLSTFWSRNKLIDRLNNLGIRKENKAFTKYVGLITGLDACDDRELFEAEWFKETVKIEFEGHLYSAPAGYDAVLRRTYGDYMKLPPAEEQVAHHVFRAWYK